MSDWHTDVDIDFIQSKTVSVDSEVVGDDWITVNLRISFIIPIYLTL